jgi:hypothetical protein
VGRCAPRAARDLRIRTAAPGRCATPRVGHDATRKRASTAPGKSFLLSCVGVVLRWGILRADSCDAVITMARPPWRHRAHVSPVLFNASSVPGRSGVDGGTHRHSLLRCTRWKQKKVLGRLRYLPRGSTSLRSVGKQCSLDPSGVSPPSTTGNGTQGAVAHKITLLRTEYLTTIAPEIYFPPAPKKRNLLCQSPKCRGTSSEYAPM